MDANKRKEADRILALGYHEFERRKHPQAKLDLLVEVCAAVCDTYIEGIPPHVNFVSDVKLTNVDLFRGRSHARGASSLADFDQPYNNGVLDAAPIPVGSGWTLSIPASTVETIGPMIQAELGPLLKKLPDMHGAKAHDDQARDSIDDADHDSASDDSPESHERVPAEYRRWNLQAIRRCYDAIASEDVNAYPLRVDYFDKSIRYLCEGEEYPVRHALGYCMPRSRFLDIADKLASKGESATLANLELILRPSQMSRFRTQADTNVATRVASLARIPEETLHVDRSRDIKLYSGIWHSAWRELENAVWGDAKPKAAFLMPMSDEQFIPHKYMPRTIAVWYLGISSEQALGSGAASISSLYWRRLQASLVFESIFMREYRRRIARVIAGHVVGATVSEINRDLEYLATAFTMPKILSVTEVSDGNGHLSLHKDIMRYRSIVGGRHDKSSWGDKVSAVLQRISVAPEDPSQGVHIIDLLHGAMESAVIDRHNGIRGIEILRARAHDLSMQLQTVVTVAMQAQVTLRQAHPFCDARWDLLVSLREVAKAPNAKACQANEHRVVYTIDGWNFCAAHDPCLDQTCYQDELLRRVAYLMEIDIKDESRAMSGLGKATTRDDFKNAAMAKAMWDRVSELPWFSATNNFYKVKFGEGYRIVKEAARQGSDSMPSIEAVVVLLLMQHANVRTIPLPKSGSKFILLRRVPELWRRSISGIAEVGRWGGRAFPMDVEWSDVSKSLLFRIRCDDNSGPWMRVEAIRGSLATVPPADPSDPGNSTTAFAAALGFDWDVPAPMNGRDDEGWMHERSGVSWRIPAEVDAIEFKWKCG